MIKRGLWSKLAEVGKIKTGYKGKEITSSKGNKFRPPKKLDHFVITTTERDANGNLIKNHEIHKRLEEKPRELSIRLPFDSIDKNFFTQYQYYRSRKKECSGDGIEAERRIFETKEYILPFEDGNRKIKASEGQVIKISCDPETCPNFQAGHCKVSGTLSAFLPYAQDLGGVYRYRTHSYNSVTSILGALEYFADKTGGIMQGLPLKMVMVKKTTEEHGNIDYVTLVIDGLEINGLRKLALEEKNNRLQLGSNVQEYESKIEAAGFFKDSDPEDVINEEFYPETINIELESENEKGTTAEEIKDKLTKPKSEEKPAIQDDKGELF